MKKERKSYSATREQASPLRIKSSKKSKNTKKKEVKSNEKLYFTQNLIGIKEIYDGFFFMKNGQVIGILEIYPINYDQRTNTEKGIIAGKFQKTFRVSPKNLHFKMRTEKADINDIIASIKQANSNEKDLRVINQMKDYIQNIVGIQGKDTYRKKFYWIYEYEGDTDGKRSNKKKEIVKHMQETRWTLITQFKMIGNSVAIPTTKWEVLLQPLEAVYKHFNPHSFREDSFENRYFRLRADENSYNNTHKNKKELRDCDYIAPRGIRLHKKAKDTLVIDGMYHTYLVINDNGYPEGLPGVVCGWLSYLLSGIDGIDIDIIAKKLPHDTTLELLQQNNKLTITRSNSKRTNPDKYEELMEKVSNLSYVIDRMKKHDEDLYNVVTIITIKANSLSDLSFKKNNVVKTLKQNSVYVTNSYRIRMPLLRMTMPFMYIDNYIFKKFSHDFLTSAMASLYWYSAYELMDQNGYVMGINLQNSTLAAFNNFSKKYVNPHILILGTSGAGKTFTEQMLGYRMRLMGMKVVYVIPSKGMLDYTGGCENIGGSFIKLGPLQETCVNIMQIRAEEENHTEEISLLAKKITSVTTFVQLLMGNEELTTTEVSKLNIVLENLYRDFGITEDNDSIFISGTDEVRPMPIIEDLYERAKDVSSLKRITEALEPFVSGSCSNMNGQTNVDLDNDYIVFDVDEDTISPRFFPAFLYVAFDCAYSIAKRSTEEYVAVFLDEVWKLMKNKLSAEQVKSMVKLLRAYNSCVVLATQDIEDFISTSDNFGKSILTNTAIKIILKLVEQEANEVGEYINLSENDKRLIESFETGNGMIIANGDKVSVYLKASEREIVVFKPRDKKGSVKRKKH